jgi:hypothetical protein
MILCFDGECHVRLNFVFAATALAPSHILHFWGFVWNLSLWQWQDCEFNVGFGLVRRHAPMTKAGRFLFSLVFFLSYYPIPAALSINPAIYFFKSKIF